MITEASIADLESIEGCARSFFKESKMPGVFDFDYWKSRWHDILSSGLGAIFIVSVQGEAKGILGGIFAECTMTGDMEAIEMFWYVMPETRGTIAGISLLRAFESTAKQKNCKRIKMIHLADLNATIMKDLYERMGYSPCEFAYWKELGKNTQL